MGANIAKPVLFFAFASELAGVALPLLAEEARRLRTVLRPAEDAGWCEVVVRQAVTLTDILNVFHDPRYHGRIALFHFSGHADAYDLLLTDAQGNAKSANAKGFAAFLAEQPGLDVVFLNACSTQPQVDDLLAAGVKAVIATGAEIPDDWALAFAERLYTGLAGGSGLAAAFRAAEGALRAELGEQEWPWRLFPAPDGGAIAGWRLKTVQMAPQDYLWVNVPLKPQITPVGRDDLLTTWIEKLTSGETRTLAIHGMPGVGKTTLALLLAHDERMREVCSDGVLWAPLGPNSSVASVQASWADALGADLSEVVEPAARQERLSRTLGDRRVLVVLDNVWDAETAQALRVSGPGALHVLTTRNEEIALGVTGAAGAVTVPTLDNETAWDLLQKLAPAVCAAEPDAARTVADTVGGLPLALELLGSHLAASGSSKFASQRKKALKAAGNPAERLMLAGERLGDVTGELQTLEAVIRLSVDELDRMAPAAVAVFKALGAFASKPATFDVAAAKAVAGADEDVLALLAGRSLVEIGADERLAVHQVVHDVMAGETPADAVTRHATYYLDFVNADPEDWQRIELVYEQVRSAGAVGDKVRFVDALATYQRRRGIWGDRLAWLDAALAQARDARDHGAEAWVLNEHGFVCDALGEKTKALEYYEQALSLQRQGDERAGEAATLTNIGAVYADLGEKDEALAYYEQALPLYRQVGDKEGEAATLNNLGLFYADLGETAKAVEYYEQSLLLRRQVGDKAGEATTLNNLGLVYSALGEKVKTLEYYEQALLLRRQVGDKRGEAATLNNLGGVYSTQGEMRRALDYYEQALPLYRQVNDKGGEAVTLTNIGAAYDDLGEKDKSLDYYEQSLPLQRQVGDKSGEAATLNNMAVLAYQRGEVAEAAAYFRQVIAVFHEIGAASEEAAVMSNLSQLLQMTTGDMEEIRALIQSSIDLLERTGMRQDAMGETIEQKQALLAQLSSETPP